MWRGMRDLLRTCSGPKIHLDVVPGVGVHALEDGGALEESRELEEAEDAQELEHARTLQELPREIGKK